MLHTRSLAFAACLTLLSGCGARTVADDYRIDAGDVPFTPDVPVSPDVPIGPDVPIRPDVPDVPPVCPPGFGFCSGNCIGLLNDVNNCGACNARCIGSSLTCQRGVCVGVTCPGGLVVCNGACTDIRSDPRNCGRCGQLCAGPGSVCSNGVCSVSACVDGLTFCNGDCVDTQNDTRHCGGCGNVCPPGGACFGGLCAVTPGCPPPTTACGDFCADLSTDLNNCGACGLVCPPGGVCAGGRCEAPMCPAPTTRCGATCANLASDPTNCGACGRACRPGQRCLAGACTTATMTGTPFLISALMTSNCRTTEHNTVTGDDRGGIALGNGQVYYTGDDRTAAFDLDTLAPTARGTQRLDGIFGVTAASLTFTLGSNRVPLDERTSIIDTVLGVSPTVAVGSTLLPLSTPIFLDRTTLMDDVGIYGGVDRLIVTAGTRAWIVEGTSATVTELAIAPIAPHQRCESWAHWGVAEFFEGAPWVAYVRDSSSIVRQNLVSGEVRVVGVFSNLSDMCSFTVSPARGRWYFHHEGSSQFRAGDETLGYCDARFSR